MAYPYDLEFSDSDVFMSDGSPLIGYVGEPLLIAGDVVYIDGDDDDRLKLAHNGTAAAANVAGICLCNAVENQPIVYAKDLNFTFGIYLDVGQTYVLSDTPGKIMSIDGFGMYGYLTYIGYADALDNMVGSIQVTGVENT